MSNRDVMHGDTCSVGREVGKNDDYALFVPGVGGCVADGVGGAPLGDAVARLACHVAMRALSSRYSAVEAVDAARDRVEEFIRAVDSPSSGASLVVIAVHDRSVEAAWLGDVAFFICFQSSDGTKILSTLDGFPTSHNLGSRVVEEPCHMEVPFGELDTVVACTDGVWRRLCTSEIARMMTSGVSVREIAARLAMAGHLDDDSTALVVSMNQNRETATHA
jgi:serine/threonine protein phosphatase PrpC